MSDVTVFYVGVAALISVLLWMWLAVRASQAKQRRHAQQIERANRQVNHAHQEARRAMNSAARQDWKNQFE